MPVQEQSKAKFKSFFEMFDKGILSTTEVANRLGVPSRTARYWIENRARLEAPEPPATPSAPPTPEAVPEPEVIVLRREVTELKAALKAYTKEGATADYIKHKVFGIVQDSADWHPPAWVLNPTTTLSRPGVPTLFASDWHFGETVFPAQINGVNEYNMAIARNRARTLIDRTVDLLKRHMVNPVYPGIVFPLGGDMVSGGIREELMATDEVEIMPCVMALVEVLLWCIKTLADEFGAVMIPCVTGNHGRDTKKIRAKGRNFTSFDWIIYRILELKLRDDKRVTFYIPDGSDALYRIYHHRYLLTHGDQFRGGDGVIGPLGPIIRGDHRKRTRNSQIDMGYDTMLIGHWHQWIMLQRLIVNGSLKGYDEYAYASNFPYERPRQGLWLTHHKRGITFALPVNVDEQGEPATVAPWASLPEAA